MIGRMTASESPLPEPHEPDFDAGTLIWADASTARRRWLADGYVAAILDGRAPPALPAATADEAAEAAGQADPAAYRLRRQAIRALAAAVLDRPATAFRIRPDGAGAPRLAEGGLSISLSGRRPLSAVLISRQPGGIDLEEILPAVAIPRNLLRPEEQDRIEALPASLQGEAFTRLWAAKEAYAKALGQGFLLPPESLLIEPGGRARYRPAHGSNGLPDGRVRLGKGFWGSDKAVIIAMALLSS